MEVHNLHRHMGMGHIPHYIKGLFHGPQNTLEWYVYVHVHVHVQCHVHICTAVCVPALVITLYVSV